MRRLTSSVRFRLTAVVTVLFALTTVSASYVLIRQLEGTLVDELRTRDDKAAAALQAMLAQSDILTVAGMTEISDADVPAGHDSDLLRETLNDSVVWIQRSGSLTSTTDSGFLDSVRNATWGKIPLLRTVMPKAIEPDQYVVSQIEAQTELGPMTLTVASPLDPIRRTVRHVSTSLYFGVPFMTAVVALLSWYLIGRSLRPVSAITRRVQAITGSTLDQRVPVPEADDEVGELAKTMNEMLARLERSAERQRQFVSDASHELRSPVASIRLQLETALMNPANTDWAAVGRTVLTEDERLGSLVDNLLAIARLDEQSRPPYVDVDIDELVLDHTARTFRVKVDRSGVSAGRVSGVPSELTSLVRNLIDNAARHAESIVRVSVTSVDGWVCLIVDDDGPGVPIELRERVFERFSRLNEARHRDAGGAGLGLALVKRVVEAHGGTVDIEDSPIGGARFVVRLSESGDK